MTTSHEAFGLSPSHPLTPERVAARGVTQADITSLAAELALVAERGHPPKFSWTSETTAEMQRLNSLDWTASQIAAVIGTTRGSVCSKIAGERRRRAQAAAPPREKTVLIPKASPAILVAAPTIGADTVNRPDTAKPWEERIWGQCCWPFTVAGEVWSCCAPVGVRSRRMNGRYCKGHFLKMFPPGGPPKEKLRGTVAFNFSNRAST